MKVVSNYCDKCGAKIHGEDFEKDLALKYKDKCFCRDCKEKVEKIIAKKKRRRRRRKKRRQEEEARKAAAREEGDSSSKEGEDDEEDKKKRRKKKKKRRSSKDEDSDDGDDERRKKKKRRRKKKDDDEESSSQKRRKKSKKSRRDEDDDEVEDDDDGDEDKKKRRKRKKKKKSRSRDKSKSKEVEESSAEEEAPEEEIAEEEDLEEDGDREKKSRRAALADKTHLRQPALKSREKVSTTTLMGVCGGLVILSMIIGWFVIMKKSQGEGEGGLSAAQANKEKQWVDKIKKTAKEHPGEHSDILRECLVLKRAIQSRTLKKEVSEVYEKVQSQFIEQQVAKIHRHLQRKDYQNALLLYFRHRDNMAPPQKSNLQSKMAEAEKSLFKVDAEKIAKPLIERAKSLSGQGDYEKAIGTLMAFNKNSYQGSSWVGRVESALDEIRREQERKLSQQKLEREAASQFRRLQASVKQALQAKNLRLAMNLLRRFPKKYRKIKKYNDWIVKVARQISSKSKEALDKKLASAPWEDLIGPNQQNMLNWTFGRGKGFSIKNGVMTVSNPNPRPSGFRATGQINWKDYLVEFEVKIVRKGFAFMVRYRRDTRDRRKVFYTLLGIGPKTLGGTNRWARVQWLIQGRSYNIRVYQNGSWGRWLRVKPAQERSDRGAIGFFTPGQAEFQVRKMKIKVISKVGGGF